METPESKSSEPYYVDLDFRLVRPTEVAKLLDVSRSTVYTLIDQGHLHAVKIGRSTRIPLRSVHDFIQALGSAETVAHPCGTVDDVRYTP